jgi:hypothetical protein
MKKINSDEIRIINLITNTHCELNIGIIPEIINAKQDNDIVKTKINAFQFKTLVSIKTWLIK